MIETKTIVKPKGNFGTGNSSGASGYGGEYVSEADYAARAGKAKKAESAGLAMRANTADTADRAKYADKAGELDEEAEVLQRYIRKDIDDIAQGTVTWEKVQKLLGGLLVGKDFSFDADGNIIAHSIASENANKAEHKGFSIIQTGPKTGKYKLNINELLAFSKTKVGDKFVFDAANDFRFDAKGNIVAHSIASENANTDEEKGFIIVRKDETGKYKLCIDELLAWGLATVKQLHVKGDSNFDGNLFSKQFVSDFLTGKGWGIYNKPVTNAAGVQENKWTGEFDNIIVRGSLRVYEMIISQLLGENDNRVFTGMMEVDHYDPESGKVYLNTQDGKLYNPFRCDDIIMVQQFNGMPNSSNDYYVVKNYELLVTDAGCGSLEDGNKRLDWVKFANFTSSITGATPEDLIRKKDTFVRVDNLSDPDRKGIMQIITVGTASPHLDVIYGLKTDPEGALKGRLGNLEGIVHPWFGRLQGFGEYLNNLYAVGDLILRRTGESVDTKFQVLENMFSSRFAKTSYELTNGKNYLENGQFLEQISDADNTIIANWEIDADEETMLWVDATGMPFMVNSTLTTSGNKKVTLEQNDGRQMLRIQNCGLRQKNAIIKQPGTHKEYVKGSGEKNDAGLSQTEAATVDVQDKLYVNIRLYAKTAGQLTYGFDGCKAVDGMENTLTAKTESIAYSGEWQTVRMEGNWNGTGDFIIRYSGDCYIALVTITDEPLSEFSKTVSTQIVQTAENIKLLGENINKVNGKTTRLGIELDVEKGEIRQYVDQTDKKNREDTSSLILQTSSSITSSVDKKLKDQYDTVTSEYSSSISQTAEGIRQWVGSQDYANNTTVSSSIEQLSGRITSTVKMVEANASSITQIQQDIDSITLTVGKAATQDQLTENVNALNKSISSNLDAAKSYARDQANNVGTGIRNDYASTITTVQQKSDSWSVAAGGFDANGKLKSSAGAVLETDFAGFFVAQIKPNGLVSEGQMNISISNGISAATIQADKINLTGHCMNFSGGQITITTPNFKLDSTGSIWCQNGTFSGTVTGVHGSFKTLDCVDSDGNVVGNIQFGSDGRMWFSGDMYHQGYDNAKKRGYRFYAADVWCRGMFGHRQKTIAIIYGGWMRIYTKDSDFADATFITKSLTSGKTSAGKSYWSVPLYGDGNGGDASGMPIDVVVMNCSSDEYYVFKGMGSGKEWRVVNGNDKQTIHFADIGGWHELKGGESLSCVYIPPSLLNPKVSESQVGAGVFWSGEADLNWS